MKLNIAIFVFSAVSAAAEEEGPIDPKKACSTNIDPVCHHDISFQNSCLAEAQGIYKYRHGVCDNDGGVLPPFTKEGQEITPEEMEVFADEGFYFVGRTRMGTKPNPEDDDPPKVGKYGGQYEDAEEGEDRRLTRVTVAGSMYVTNHFVPSFEGEEHFDGTRGRMLRGRKAEEEEESESDSGANDARKLSVFLDGSDDRSQIRDPYSASSFERISAGELLYDGLDATSSLGLGSGSNCTATVIGRNKILTAAHCVYNPNRGEYHVPTGFAPRRYVRHDGRPIDPKGRWPVLFATIHTAYVSPPDIWGWPWDYIPYDVAVINLGTGGWSTFFR
jgi:hypothetical protein